MGIAININFHSSPKLILIARVNSSHRPQYHCMYVARGPKYLGWRSLLSWSIIVLLITARDDNYMSSSCGVLVNGILTNISYEMLESHIGNSVNHGPRVCMAIISSQSNEMIMLQCSIARKSLSIESILI